MRNTPTSSPDPNTTEGRRIPSSFAPNRATDPLSTRKYSGGVAEYCMDRDTVSPTPPSSIAQ